METVELWPFSQAGIANPAALVKTPNKRSRPIVWEPERVERWQTTGEVPSPVMVWTDELLADFLDYAADPAPDVHPMLHLMAYRGTRRGETCGLLDAEVRLRKAEIGIINQITMYGGGNIRHKKPKSEAGNRDVILEPRHRRSLHQLQSPASEVAAGRRPRLARHRTVLRPPRRQSLAPRLGLPALPPTHPTRRLPTHPPPRPTPLRRHHRPRSRHRHQSRLRTIGHSTTTLTRDTYQSVAEELHHEAAGAVAERIKVKRRNAA
jgi:hypothetical protein